MRHTVEHLKVLVAGHLDHGKSTLIGRLLVDTRSWPRERLAALDQIGRELGVEAELAFLVDQLKEERLQGRTMDMTQVLIKAAHRSYVFIDAPGHTELIHNMLTAASRAQVALLVVAADEGIKEQTRKHAFLIHMLDIKSVITVITKMDVVNYKEDRFQKINQDVAGVLDRLNMKALSSVPVSAKGGDNISDRSRCMTWHQGPCLLQALDEVSIPFQEDRKPLRVSVQDVYPHGTQTIVVGRIESGVIRKGQSVKIHPGARESKIERLMMFEKPWVFKAAKGENPGLILANSAGVKRGEMIVDQDPVESTQRFKANVFWIGPEVWIIGMKMTLRCGTQEAPVEIESITRRIDPARLDIVEDADDHLGIQEAAEIVLRADNPLVLEKFSFIEPLGRFIIENNNVIQGVGIVTQTGL